VHAYDTCVLPQTQGSTIDWPRHRCTKRGTLTRRKMTNADVHVANILGQGWMVLFVWRSGGPVAAVGGAWVTDYWREFLRAVQRQNNRG
jgi:hypothetical protein